MSAIGSNECLKKLTKNQSKTAKSKWIKNKIEQTLPSRSCSSAVEYKFCNWRWISAISFCLFRVFKFLHLEISIRIIDNLYSFTRRTFFPSENAFHSFANYSQHLKLFDFRNGTIKWFDLSLTHNLLFDYLNHFQFIQNTL